MCRVAAERVIGGLKPYYRRRDSLLRDYHAEATGLGCEGEADAEDRPSHFLQGRAMTEAQVKLIGAAVISIVLLLSGCAVAWFWQAKMLRQGHRDERGEPLG